MRLRVAAGWGCWRSVAGVGGFVRGGRRLRPRLAGHRPWADDIAAAGNRLQALLAG